MTVFGVKYRLGLISPKWEKQLHAVIANILNRIDGVHAIEIGGYKDHIHILYSTSGKVSETSVMTTVKVESSKWINRNKLCVGKFGWQDGGGHFSYSQGQVEVVRNYIRNQAEHHRTISFHDEFAEWLHRACVEIDEYSLPSEPE